MLGDIDIEKWLFEHSSSMQRNDREIIYDHPTGSRSVLLLCETWNLTKFEPFPPLASFYTKYAGGFIGDRYLVIGTSADESITTSDGMIVPSVQEIRAVAEKEGMTFNQDEMPFMTTRYMFVYSFSKAGKLRCHDRDFRAVTEDETVHRLLADWWTMELDDQQ